MYACSNVSLKGTLRHSAQAHTGLTRLFQPWCAPFAVLPCWDHVFELVNKADRAYCEQKKQLSFRSIAYILQIHSLCFTLTHTIIIVVQHTTASVMTINCANLC